MLQATAILLERDVVDLTLLGDEQIIRIRDLLAPGQSGQVEIVAVKGRADDDLLTRLDPLEPEAWGNLAMAYLGLGRVEDALAAVREPWEPETTARNLRLIREACEPPGPRRRTALAVALDYAGRVQKKHAIVFVVSDFLGDDAAGDQAVLAEAVDHAVQLAGEGPAVGVVVQAHVVDLPAVAAQAFGTVAHGAEDQGELLGVVRRIGHLAGDFGEEATAELAVPSTGARRTLLMIALAVVLSAAAFLLVENFTNTGCAPCACSREK